MSVDAYGVRFDVTLFATDAAAASRSLAVWRQLAEAIGFAPGEGRTRRVPDNELDHHTLGLLEARRAKEARVATPHARERAIEALATHLDGDLEEARKIVDSIETASGALPIVVADWMADGRRRAQEPARDALDEATGESRR